MSAEATVEIAGPCQAGMEKAFTAQQLVFQPFYLLNLHGNALFVARHIAGIHQQRLARRQEIFHQFAVDLHKRHATAAEPLHDKPFAAKKAGAQFFLEGDGKLYRRLGRQKGVLLQDHRPLRRDFQRQDAPGKAGAKGDNAVALGGIDVLEHGFAG